MSEFNDYLTQKKIDWKSYRDSNPEQYKEFEDLFMQLHPQSFTDQKLFLINAIRRQFPVKIIENEPVKPKAKAKPKIIPRIKK